MMTTGSALLRRLVLAGIVGGGLGAVTLPGIVSAADPVPSSSADASVAPTRPPASTASPTASPTPTPAATHSPAPTPPPTPAPTPVPSPTPSPTAAPTPPPSVPPLGARSMNTFVASQFAFQDPNMAACTATSVRTMLNFVASRHTGGPGFIWQPTNWGSVRDRILAWERAHDTMTGGAGSDPHGWRNALNFYGWGPNALVAGARVYDDVPFATYDIAMKAAVRALISTGKPIGMLGWRGGHAQMITGYFGLIGNPFARNASGQYLNAFSVAGFYLTDPLRKSGAVNRVMSYAHLRATLHYQWRFQRFYETDSKLDDPYTPGYRTSKIEWYGRFVLILPIR